MKTKYKIIGAVLIVVVAAAIVSSYFLFIQDDEEGPGDTDSTIAEIRSMQLTPGDDYIEQLEEIVNTSQDPKVKEIALLTLTDIAIRFNETEDVVGFLKEVAIGEHEVNVMSAAFACVDLIRELYPPDKKATLELELTGDIRKGGNVTLTATVESSIDIEALVGINHLLENIEPRNAPIQQTELEAGIPQRVQFKLYLADIGEYVIPVTLMLSFDRVDFETTSKKVLLTVHEEYGEVNILSHW